jgi:hypothetical protein
MISIHSLPRRRAEWLLTCLPGWDMIVICEFVCFIKVSDVGEFCEDIRRVFGWAYIGNERNEWIPMPLTHSSMTSGASSSVTTNWA